jgi:hypothetical protein
MGKFRLVGHHRCTFHGTTLDNVQFVGLCYRAAVFITAAVCDGEVVPRLSSLLRVMEPF